MRATFVFLLFMILCFGAVAPLASQRPALPVPDDADQPVRTEAKNPDAVAIVIGISEYQDMDIPGVAYAASDVQAVQRVLTQTLGYADARVLVRMNNQASLGRLKLTIRQTVASMVKPGASDVFLYYSGHGAPNANTKEGYLIPYDYDPSFEPAPDSAYALKDLYADLGKLGARSVTVILESCFSGRVEAADGTKALTKAASPLVVFADNPAATLTNGLVIAASGGSEIASWHPSRPHGLMTYYWLRAMRGEAGDDQGRVTPNRLKQYLRENVTAIARQSKGRTQTPDVVTAQPDRVLAQLPVSALRTGDARVVARTGSLEVFIDIGADLSIDGTPQGTIRPGGTYVNDKIAAGPHQIVVRKDGYETVQENIVILPDQTAKKTYLLTANLPTAARLDRAYGLIEVSVDRGGALYIDDKKTEDLPPFGRYTTPRIEAGPHRVRVEKAGYVTLDQEVLVRPNNTARLDLTLNAVATAPASRAATADRPTTVVARESSTGMEFVRIQPGEFMMGCSPGDNECLDFEKPAHRVRITKGFEMGKYEVTQAQWESVMASNPSNFKGADRPVETVSWNDAQQFLSKLNAKRDGYQYRLPTEAEWEYAARAGTNGAYAGSLEAMAWYNLNSGNQTHPVGQKQANAWGLHDMLGNVLEWVQDWFDFNYYKSSPASDPAGASSGRSRVLRGGSWNYVATVTRASVRGGNEPTDRYNNLGFRCVREAR